MSSARPENGLPERRPITADSFRALKLKLARLKAPEPDHTAPRLPAESAPIALPPPADILAETIETLPEPDPVSLPDTEPSPIEASDIADEPRAETASEESTPPCPEIAELPGALPDEAQGPSPEERPSAWAPVEEQGVGRASIASSLRPSDPRFIERRVLEKPQPEDVEAGMRAHALLDIMAIPTEGSLPQERALANDTLLRLVPRMPLKSLKHLAERVCMMEAPSQMLVRRLINDARIEVSGPLLEQAMTIDDSDLIALVHGRSPAKLKLMARRRVISPALSEALIQANDIDTLINLVRNRGASFSIESMWRLTRLAADHPVLQAPLVTRPDTPSPIAFQLFWRLPSELRRYVLSRFLTDSETITRILTMNRENDGGTDRRPIDPALLRQFAAATPEAAGELYARLTHVSEETGSRIADDTGGEALTVALKAAGLTRAQFAEIVEKRPDADALKAIFETLSFNKARVLLTYWDWAAKRTGPYARTAAT
jgi:uncharacterized protein (DUF2336 family)